MEIETTNDKWCPERGTNEIGVLSVIGSCKYYFHRGKWMENPQKSIVRVEENYIVELLKQCWKVMINDSFCTNIFKESIIKVQDA